MKIDMVDYLHLHLQLSRDGDRDGGVRGWGAVWERVPAVEETDPGQAGEQLFKEKMCNQGSLIKKNRWVIIQSRKNWKTK